MYLITTKKIFEKFNINSHIKDIPKKIYIFHQKGLFKKIENKFNFKKIKFTRGDLYFEENNQFAIITNFGTGYSSALMLAEELSGLGFKKVIGFGIAGFINSKNNIKIGDLFVIKKMYSQINLSEISKNTNDYIENDIFLKNLKEKNSISVISLYKESYQMIKNCLSKDISIIDMELYPLALIFQEKGVDFNQVIAVSDILKNNY